MRVGAVPSVRGDPFKRRSGASFVCPTVVWFFTAHICVPLRDVDNVCTGMQATCV